MDEEGNRSGYGYDFLRLMARYWDVDYEYVGCEGICYMEGCKEGCL